MLNSLPFLQGVTSICLVVTLIELQVNRAVTGPHLYPPFLIPVADALVGAKVVDAPIPVNSDTVMADGMFGIMVGRKKFN